MSQFKPAQGPHGVRGTLHIPGRGPVSIELLEVQDTAFLVSYNGRIAVAPYRAISRAHFDQMGYLVVEPRRAPTPEAREQLRFASRFPYGISRGRLTVLLEYAGQGALDNLGDPAATRERE